MLWISLCTFANVLLRRGPRASPEGLKTGDPRADLEQLQRQDRRKRGATQGRQAPATEVHGVLELGMDFLCLTFPGKVTWWS